MHSSGDGRYGASKGAYTPNIAKPDARAGKARIWVYVALVIALPPVGLALLWRAGLFPLRGRILLSVLGAVCLSAMIAMMLPKQTLVQVAATPVVPLAATKEPETDVVTALSNIEELLASEDAADSSQIQEGDVAPAQGGEGAQDTAADEAAQEEILNTVVYSVYSGAKYYHTAPTCGSQKNGRELTVREALSEGLGACPDCNPPAIS